ncbi:MAG TPA: hypothetical protein VMB27_03705 [Solirubrobacteraceae bacterium]|nr:hypothetical protein [Solirubrobacteraceae bacterium]
MTRALALAVVALAIAGCGSSSPSLSRLRRQATRICQSALAKSDRIAPPALPSDTAPFLRRGAAVLSTELAELRTLSVPTENAASYSAALTAQSRQLTTLDETIRDLDRGADAVSAVRTLQRRLAPTESAEDAAWRTLDIPACAVR